jgi:hypothetical protein
MTVGILEGPNSILWYKNKYSILNLYTLDAIKFFFLQ